MIGRNTWIREPYASWSARSSLFALMLIGTALLLHRVSVLTTPVAINAVGVGFVFAALGMAVGLYAAGSIWVRGRSGAWSCAGGLLVAGALFVWPVAMTPTFFALPNINDITTDTVHPPQLVTAARSRAPGANDTRYPGGRNAALQAKVYPDLRTFVIPRPAEDVYELALDLVGGRRGLGWKVVAEAAPQTRQGKPGVIEATDRTLILGFVDDVAIRIGGSDTEARLDIRSASRYGSHDFGANAARIRRFVRELSNRLDQAGPVGVAARGGIRINQADAPGGNVKRPLSRTVGKEDRRR